MRHRATFLLFVVAATLPAGLAGQSPKAGLAAGTAEVARAEALVRDVFKQEYARALADRAARKELAATLLRQARQIREEPAVRFVALREARDLAARAGDTATAFAAITELGRDGAADVLAMKEKVVADAAGVVAGGEDSAALANIAVSLANSAADAEDFDRAARLAALAEAAARKAGAPALLAAVGKRAERLRALQKETARVRPFVKKVKADPGDAEACREVGRYWALFRGSWLRGLPLLARGDDAVLSGMARKDLAEPRQASGQVELGDGWWDLAQREQGAGRGQMLARSFYWYQQAFYRLKGPARRRVEERLDVLRKAVPPELRVTDVVVEIRRLEGHTAEILGCALSADGRYALSASADRTVRLWDTATGQQVRLFQGHGLNQGHAGPVFGVAFAPDGKLAASCGEDRMVRLWEVETGKERFRLEGHTDAVNNVAFAPDGKHLASASDDRTVRMWDVATGKEVRRFAGHTQGAYCVAFSPDGTLLASGGSDQTVRLWSWPGGAEKRRLQGHTGQVLSVAFAPDGRRLLSSGEDQTIRLWDVATGKELRRYLGHTATVGGVAFAPDGLRFLSCSDDRTLRLWDVETGKEVRQLQGHTEAIYRVAFSRDGRLALTCSLDRTLRLWGGPR
jgi:hypothetical protein